MQQFEVFHRRNRITFTGVHLAHASSWRPHSPRWAELDLYTTETEGVWVFSRVGHSVVYHVPSSSSLSLTCPRRLPYGHQVTGALPPASELVPCDVCNPCLPPSAADDDESPAVTTTRGASGTGPERVGDFWTTHVFETPRPYAVVCDSAAMVDRQLRASDGSMGWLSMQLARDAATKDLALGVIAPAPLVPATSTGAR